MGNTLVFMSVFERSATASHVVLTAICVVCQIVVTHIRILRTGLVQTLSILPQGALSLLMFPSPTLLGP